jgi:hypothetical protein
MLDRADPARAITHWKQMQAQQSWSSQTAVVTCVSAMSKTLVKGQRRAANLNSDWLMVSAPRTVHAFSPPERRKPDSARQGG